MRAEIHHDVLLSLHCQQGKPLPSALSVLSSTAVIPCLPINNRPGPLQPATEAEIRMSSIAEQMLSPGMQ